MIQKCYIKYLYAIILFSIVIKELKKWKLTTKKCGFRAKIVMQFLFLRERLDFTQQEIVDKMGVMCQLITRFDNMSNSLVIFILVK